jgi:hypothetical protein
MEYNDFEGLVTETIGIEDAAKDKGLAKLGDELINFCFSLAKSIFLNKCTGEKVSAKILTRAMKDSDLRKFAKLRAKSHDIADAAEGIIAYSFLSRSVTIEDITNKILAGYSKNNDIDISSGDLDSLALTELLLHLKTKIRNPSEEKN